MHSPGFRSGVQQGMINGASSNNIENVGGKNPLNLEWVVHQTFIDQGTDNNSNKLENCLVFVRYLWRLTQFFLWRLWSLHFFSLADCMGPANRGSVSRGLRSLCCDAGLRDEGKSGAAGGLCQSLCFVFDISNSFSNAFFLSPLNSLNKRGGMLMMLEGQNYFPGNQARASENLELRQPSQKLQSMISISMYLVKGSYSSKLVPTWMAWNTSHSEMSYKHCRGAWD